MCPSSSRTRTLHGKPATVSTMKSHTLSQTRFDFRVAGVRRCTSSCDLGCQPWGASHGSSELQAARSCEPGESAAIGSGYSPTRSRRFALGNRQIAGQSVDALANKTANRPGETIVANSDTVRLNPNTDIGHRRLRSAGFQPAVSPTSSRQAAVDHERVELSIAAQVGSPAIRQAGKPVLRSRSKPASASGLNTQ
jgi:hypothetical protein